MTTLYSDPCLALFWVYLAQVSIPLFIARLEPLNHVGASDEILMLGLLPFCTCDSDGPLSWSNSAE